ncbi:MAG: MBL fold metallo-hydrolase [Desulfobacterales bacterium]|nr:MBL fold metallo-hydrolase [Desulfobacterales bacterium]
MYIKSWGSRGSIPVSGPEYTKYGGDTTCLEIRTKSGHLIIVDAGTGIRRLGNQLSEADGFKCHFIFTHAHWDHIMGFPHFKPIHSPTSRLRMYMPPLHCDLVEDMLARVMAPPNYPVKYSEIEAGIQYRQISPAPFEIGSMVITPIPLSHPNSGSGYKFVEDGKTFVFLTDNELGHIHAGGRPAEDYQAFAADADLLIHDAEYTLTEYKKYIQWGHSAFAHVIKLAAGAGVRRLGLFHHNEERTDQDLDAIVRDCNRLLAKKKPALECFAVGSDDVFEL